MAEAAFPKLHKALKFALKAHKGQDRDGPMPLPYVTHPIEVVILLRYVGGVTDEDTLTAAALHDCLEETEVTQEEIEAAFGGNVLQIVLEVTRREPRADEIVGLNNDEVWILRTRIFMDEIRRMSRAARLIKLADRHSNLGNAFTTRPPEKLERYTWQSMMILEIIPRDTNPALWDGIQAMIDRVPVSDAVRRRLAL